MLDNPSKRSKPPKPLQAMSNVEVAKLLAKLVVLAGRLQVLYQYAHTQAPQAQFCPEVSAFSPATVAIQQAYDEVMQTRAEATRVHVRKLTRQYAERLYAMERGANVWEVVTVLLRHLEQERVARRSGMVADDMHLSFVVYQLNQNYDAAMQSWKDRLHDKMMRVYSYRMAKL